MFGSKLTRKDRQQQAYVHQEESKTTSAPGEKIVYVPVIMDAVPTWGYHLETVDRTSRYAKHKATV